jgi:hypothetical protein
MTPRAIALGGLKPEPEKKAPRKQPPKRKGKPETVSIPYIGQSFTQSYVPYQNPTLMLTTSSGISTASIHPWTTYVAPNSSAPETPETLQMSVQKAKNIYTSLHGHTPTRVQLGLKQTQELQALLNRDFHGAVPSLPINIVGLRVLFHGSDSLIRVLQ